MTTIGIVSLKGGVGKTSSVVSLGTALAEFGKKVLLVDANFSAPNLGIHLNLMSPDKHIHQVMSKEINPSEAIYDAGIFHVLPASVYSDEVHEPLRLKERLRHLKRSYDYILIDSSPALNQETLAAMIASDLLFVVATPDYSTLSMTLKAIRMAKKRGTPIEGIILNKVYNKNFELSFKEIEDAAEVPILAVIPHDLKIPESQSNFCSFLDYSPSSEGSEEFRKLAAAIIGEEYKPVKLKNFLRWILPKQQDINRTVYYKRIFDEE